VFFRCRLAAANNNNNNNTVFYRQCSWKNRFNVLPFGVLLS
jgi:hypothetical protein